MRFPIGALLLGFIFALAACSGGNQQSTATSSESAEPTASPADTSSASAEATIAVATPSPGAAGTAVAVPTPTPNANLLDIANGTVLRSYSPPQLDGMSDGNLGNAAEGIGSEIPDAAKPPYVFTFELPGIATISEFDVNLRAPNKDGDTNTATVAISTTSATDGFHDVGNVSYKSGDANRKGSITGNFQARWLRLTSNALIDSISATGTIAPSPTKIDPTGMYIEDPVPDLNGGFVASGRKPDDSRVRVVVNGNELVATECDARESVSNYIGTFDGRSWASTFAGNSSENPDKFRGAFNNEGTIFAGRTGDGGGSSVVFMRTTDTPAFCAPRVSGTGTHHYLVLNQPRMNAAYPTETDPPLAGYTFTSITGGMLTPASFQGQEGAVVSGVCHLNQVMGPNQIQLLTNWVSQGHKLIVFSTGCHEDSDYGWLPYRLQAVQGPETNNASLIQVEQSALGTNDKQDNTHFVDVAAYVKNQNALDSDYVLKTMEPHWCGHFFVAKPTNYNGFVQAYTPYGNGFIIYDGFNGDDSNLQLQKIRQLELALPIPAALPCSQKVSESFILAPNQELTFRVGNDPKTGAQLQLLANQGFSGHATVKAAGDLPAIVSPNAFDIAGGVQNLNVAVNSGAAKNAGAYTVTLNADNGAGQKSTATLLLTGTAPLKKATMAVHQRIRIYGIHFDYDSATIQPKSEPVIADIASMMKANPGWHFEVSGHTDSDGGAPYNQALSQRRAQSVVNDLVQHYGIAKSRLVAKGYGLTRPVAANTSDAGKALNRRVELERVE